MLRVQWTKCWSAHLHMGDCNELSPSHRGLTNAMRGLVGLRFIPRDAACAHSSLHSLTKRTVSVRSRPICRHAVERAWGATPSNSRTRMLRHALLTNQFPYAGTRVPLNRLRGSHKPPSANRCRKIEGATDFSYAWAGIKEVSFHFAVQKGTSE